MSSDWVGVFFDWDGLFSDYAGVFSDQLAPIVLTLTPRLTGEPPSPRGTMAALFWSWGASQELGQPRIPLR